MSNNETNNNDIVVKFELPQIVNEALVPLASSIGTTLSTAWKGFTIGIDTWYGRKKIEQEHNLNLYAEEIQKQLTSIPEENIQEPKMNILGPSLEASKYYFEEDWYRTMFAKLIAGTCDNRTNDKIHPFFVEAIKQMTPKEAKLLSHFKSNTNCPIAKYHLKLAKGSGRIDLFDNVFYINNTYTQPDYFSSSIINLQRLGLISLDYSIYLTDESLYDVFKNDPVFLSYKDDIKIKYNQDSNFPYDKLDIAKGIIKLTELGKNFVDICV